ncbi:hypothetical protein DRH29_00500 [candidate division Kazan bacterium]|uniref:Uncharacterized protein n=1 Tax=candidate division Kazan bacterium TaxID=2202143 RepID=A0A420ZEB0_UNCK3|nr:MAG: hypothetical protein DRH29_00500 [candidate division Kazan bacterium]
MATRKQIAAAKRNIKKAQAKWRKMGSRKRAVAQPQGRGRAKPGSTGKGQYYHITVRPKTEFRSFRIQDVGKKGHIQRVAGRRSSGSWATHKWLISKADARKVGGKLVGKTPAAKKVLKTLASTTKFMIGDKFTAKPRRNVPEREKPTLAQKRAQARNIRKAQAARRGRIK